MVRNPYNQRMIFKDIVCVSACILVALLFGVTAAGPVILDLELKAAAINYLNSH